MSAIDGLPGDWQLVVGLEVHVELATATKLFSGSPNRFGDEPNTNIDPVTLGLPGALPVLNEHAVELAMRIGLALNCRVQPCTFHRKNYFYPDMPKAYQISQYDQPLCAEGSFHVPGDGAFTVGITRAHLEEDAAKMIHAGGDGGRISGSAGSVVDFVDVYWRTHHFCVFNVADSAISVGVGLMILDMLGLGGHASKTA